MGTTDLVARNRQLRSNLQATGTPGPAAIGWALGSRNLEPLIFSVVLAAGIHAAVLSIPLRGQPPADVRSGPPGVRSLGVRASAATSARVLDTSGRSSTSPSTPDKFETRLPGHTSAPESLRPIRNAPSAAEHSRVSPPESSSVFRMASGLGDNDFFSRQALDIGPYPTLPVLIEYPRSDGEEGTHTSELSLFIDETGRVVRIRMDGRTLPPAMEDAARRAFMGSVFSPGVLDGLPVRSKIRVEVTFESGTAARN